ncbi:NADH:ubiquinone reductase (Na(+)-transporting) subunit F [Paraconexibacter sp.]|uniref:NADH:ubiquinone reductase (Na(+)-transporting) subunit F n=1 Tax=Paraconexibacter sp. TaxID=2949640 RepID=UPI0035619558
MARVVLEPIGEEIDCDEDETVLDAAFRQGFNLVYGCKEGQCSACKCYLLEGEVSLKKYSTFALSESEEANGYSLLCRAMPDEDLVIELLHFDPDGYKMDHELRDGRAVVESVEALTHDITRLVLRVTEPQDFAFSPGAYVDVHVPGTDGAERRSFSLANLPDGSTLELMIKRYDGGRIAGMLESGEIGPGTELGFTGPYGAFRLRSTDRPILMVAGGSGMAPQLGILRQMATEGCDRPVRFFYGARTRADLFHLDEIAALGERLPDFAFTAVLSDATPDCAWDGPEGFVHEAVGQAFLDGGLAADVEAYLCGPPPLVDAAIDLLVDGRGLDAQQVHYDKFTTAVSDRSTT